MNCKPGDLAIFVRSESGNHGRIVRCLRLASHDECEQWSHRTEEGPVWLVDRLVPRVWKDGAPGPAAPLAKDVNLRPLRDPGDDASDETLGWLPVPSIKNPNKETA